MKNLKDMLNESRGDDKVIEKKAEEIAKKHMPFGGVPITECIDATLEMAEWMKSYMIEKARLWLEANAEDYAGTTVRGDGYMDDDFYKDFCEAMEK